MHYQLLIVVLITTAFPTGLLSAKSTQIRCHHNLCEKTPEKYPTKNIKMFLSKHRPQLDKMKPIIEPFTKTNIPMNDVVQRASFAPSEENLCKSRKITVFPKYDNDTNLTIVNQNGFRQKVIFEICENERGKCSKSAIFDFETSCQQLYQNVQFLCMNKEESTLEYKSIRVPSVCVCVYKRKLTKEYF